MAGAVFGLWEGWALACILSTLGATLCYCLSDLFGKHYVLYYFGDRLCHLQAKVHPHPLPEDSFTSLDPLADGREQ